MNVIPGDWDAAVQAASSARRVMVIGASDTGKSSFVREVLARDAGMTLVDLDPGQKMIGAPGTIGLGRMRRDGSLALERFFFVRSPNPLHLREFMPALRNLLSRRRRRMVVNTSGFVDGVGARLQQLTAQVLRPELIIAIAEGAELDQLVAMLGGTEVVRIGRPSCARNRGLRERRRVRREAFAAALDGAARQTLRPDIPFRPAPPATFDGPARPVCAVADSSGRQVCIGVVENAGAGGVTIFAPKPSLPAGEVLLGRMWAKPIGMAWQLVERSQPSWRERLSDA